MCGDVVKEMQLSSGKQFTSRFSCIHDFEGRLSDKCTVGAPCIADTRFTSLRC